MSMDKPYSASLLVNIVLVCSSYDRYSFFHTITFTSIFNRHEKRLTEFIGFLQKTFSSMLDRGIRSIKYFPCAVRIIIHICHNFSQIKSNKHKIMSNAEVFIGLGEWGVIYWSMKFIGLDEQEKSLIFKYKEMESE